MVEISALVVMGVAGCGKSSISQAISESIEATMIEGDAFHSAENITKMTAGQPLNDQDRAGWLESLAAILADAVARGQRPVLACSALKKSYRNILRSKTPGLGFIFLEMTREVANDRVSHRPGHFMPASLIDSQFATLEPPYEETNVLTVDATLPIEEIVQHAVAWLKEPSARARAASKQPTNA